MARTAFAGGSPCQFMRRPERPKALSDDERTFSVIYFTGPDVLLSRDEIKLSAARCIGAGWRRARAFGKVWMHESQRRFDEE
jgi:hypothetical protein